MKIKVMRLLRGAEICADIGDVITVSDFVGKSLVECSAAVAVVEPIPVKAKQSDPELDYNPEISETVYPAKEDGEKHEDKNQHTAGVGTDDSKPSKTTSKSNRNRR